VAISKYLYLGALVLSGKSLRVCSAPYLLLESITIGDKNNDRGSSNLFYFSAGPTVYRVIETIKGLIFDSTGYERSLPKSHQAAFR
jgi:hypothetical protein